MGQYRVPGIPGDFGIRTGHGFSQHLGGNAQLDPRG